MMQNLTLPTSQTLALGVMEAVKNSANADKPSTDKASAAEPNTSFEMMLNRQVKAHKDAIQQKPAQQNSAQKKASDQKQVQHKAEQGKQANGKSVQNNQNSDDSVDANISMAQMVGEAKALLANNDTENSPVELADKQTEEVANNSSLINAAGPILSSELLKLTSTSTLASVRNNASADNSKENKLLNVDAPAALNSPIVTQNNADISQHNSDVGDTDSQQDRVLWASVTATTLNQTRLNQNSTLVDGNTLLNVSKEVTTKAVDSVKFADVVNSLAIQANQQNQAPQSNSILGTHQLGSNNQINAYPGRAGWDQAISQKVVWMVGAAEQTATLTLNPPDLGPLQVVINVRNDMADTTFISDNAEVRQALQDGMANLREKMAESGIQLGQANVNSGERPKQEFQQAALNQQPSKFSGSDSNFPIETTTQKVDISRINNGLVDTFA
jgi:flagellar hook-length control protein FliK